ncbi:MAG: hypothetical protein ACRETW_08905 [Stenotrophobium sp.]
MRETTLALSFMLALAGTSCSSDRVVQTAPLPSTSAPTPITENTPFPQTSVAPGNAAAAGAVPSDAVPAELPPPPPVLTRDGAVLLGQPRPNDPDTQPLPDGTPVQVVSPLTNSSGTWWYVKVKGIGPGWIEESKLNNPPPRLR